MAIGDRVIFARVASAIDQAGGYRGEILVGVLETAADPAPVLWENGEAGLTPLSVLRKVLDPDAWANAKLGQWLQLTDWNVVSTDPAEPSGNPKSGGMSGVCVRALGLGDIGSTVVTQNVVQIALEGTLFAASDTDPTVATPVLQERAGQRRV